MAKTGVYPSIRKNGKIYYRASITYRAKHISLGSYLTESEANQAYLSARELLSDSSPCTVLDYPPQCSLSFHKWVVLINFRDNRIYFKNPIYLNKRDFLYYVDQTTVLRFDAEDLFYYAHHKIQQRGGYLFVCDYGMQTNILSRYGIRNHAVPGRDYIFANGDHSDYRYSNIKIINRYYGVSLITDKGKTSYLTKIHINGDYIVGSYPTEQEAAIAYNKAAALLGEKGYPKNYASNYIEGMDAITYASLYQRLSISKKLRNLPDYTVK